jgi:hypothetical protein
LSEQCHTCASRWPQRRPLPVLDGGGHAGAERAPRLVKRAGDLERRPLVEFGVAVPRHHGGLAGYQVRLAVLVVAALADEVDQHPVHPTATGDVRNHVAASPSIASSMRRTAPHSSGTSASASPGNRPVASAWAAS